MEKIFKKYKNWFIAIGILCALVLPHFIFEGQDPVKSFFFGLLFGGVITYVLFQRQEMESHRIYINRDNIKEYFDDLEDRINLAEEFVLSSHNKNLKKEWEQIRQWDEDMWEIYWEARNKPTK